jgi:hypothetical protein
MILCIPDALGTEAFFDQRNGVKVVAKVPAEESLILLTTFAKTCFYDH